MSENNLYLVTGGAGMLGHSIVEQLLEEGKTVRVLDLNPCEHSEIQSIIGDVRNSKTVDEAVKGVDVVIHSAAQVWAPGIPFKTFEDTNVMGTENIIRSCLKYGVKKLVYSSSIDVVMQEPLKEINNGDESLPYPDPLPENPYPQTKIRAEKAILEANGDQLATCSLRLAGLYGPRDKYHLPNFLDLAKKCVKIRVGNGSSRFQHCYCGNAAYAHILAAKHLDIGSKIAGKVYFITDFEPKNLFSFNDTFVQKMGLKPGKRSIPFKVAYVLAKIAETFNPKGIFTTFSVASCCLNITFSGEKARQDFGFTPRYTEEEAFETTLKWFQENYPINN